MDDKKQNGAETSATGKKTGADKDTPVKSTTEKKTAPPKDAALEALAKKYAQLYPDNPCIYLTSDRQLFLAKDKNLAELHQRTLKGGTIQEVKTNAKE